MSSDEWNVEFIDEKEYRWKMEVREGIEVKVYEKFILPKSVFLDLKTREKKRCGYPYCPGLEHDINDLVNFIASKPICKVCSRTKSRVQRAQKNRLKREGKETEGTVRQKVRAQLPPEKFCCYGPTCKKEDGSGTVKDISLKCPNTHKCRECDRYHAREGRRKRSVMRISTDYQCVKCGCNERYSAQNNHIDTKKKKGNVAAHRNFYHLVEEKQWTEEVCKTCHFYITEGQVVNEKGLVDFEERAQEELRAAQLNGEVEYKLCIGLLCKDKQRNMPLTSFKTGINTCKCCQGEYFRLHRRRGQNHIAKWKIDQGECKGIIILPNGDRENIGCGLKSNEENHTLFECDHIIHETKRNGVSNYANCSLKKINEELDKCQLLCKVCHDLKTAREQNRVTIEGLNIEEVQTKRRKLALEANAYMEDPTQIPDTHNNIIIQLQNLTEKNAAKNN